MGDARRENENIELKEELQKLKEIIKESYCTKKEKEEEKSEKGKSYDEFYYVLISDDARNYFKDFFNELIKINDFEDFIALSDKYLNEIISLIDIWRKRLKINEGHELKKIEIADGDMPKLLIIAIISNSENLDLILKKLAYFKKLLDAQPSKFFQGDKSRNIFPIIGAYDWTIKEILIHLIEKCPHPKDFSSIKEFTKAVKQFENKFEYFVIKNFEPEINTDSNPYINPYSKSINELIRQIEMDNEKNKEIIDVFFQKITYIEKLTKMDGLTYIISDASLLQMMSNFRFGNFNQSDFEKFRKDLKLDEKKSAISKINQLRKIIDADEKLKNEFTQMTLLSILKSLSELTQIDLEDINSIIKKIDYDAEGNKIIFTQKYFESIDAFIRTLPFENQKEAINGRNVLAKIWEVDIKHTPLSIEGINQLQQEEEKYQEDVCLYPTEFIQVDKDLLAKSKNKVIQMMRFFDKAKYPVPPYEYKRYEDEHGKSVVHIVYHTYKVPHFNSEEIRKTNDIAIRKLNIIASVLTGLSKEDFLGILLNSEKNLLIQQLMALAETVCADVSDLQNPNDSIADFYLEVAKCIAIFGSNLSFEEIVKNLINKIKLPVSEFIIKETVNTWESILERSVEPMFDFIETRIKNQKIRDAKKEVENILETKHKIESLPVQEVKEVEEKETLRHFLFTEIDIKKSIQYIEEIAKHISLRKQIQYITDLLDVNKNYEEHQEVLQKLQRYEQLDKQISKFEWHWYKSKKNRLEKEMPLIKEFNQLKKEIKDYLDNSYEEIKKQEINLDFSNKVKEATKKLCQDTRPGRENFNLLNQKFGTEMSHDLNDYLFVKGKSGGTSLAGPLGGECITCIKKNGECKVQRALVKQESKGEKLLHHKNISEFIASRIMNALHPNVAAPVMLGAPGNQDAHHPNSDMIYNISPFFTDYSDLDKKIYELENKNIQKWNQGRPLEEQKEEIIYPGYRAKGIGVPGRYDMGFGEMYKRHLVDPGDPTKCVFKDFAPATIASLFVGDFDVHSANYGLVKKKDDFGNEDYYLVRIDMGAAMEGLGSPDNRDQIHIHSHIRHPVGPAPSNHFTELPHSLKINKDFSDELYRQGTVDLNTLNTTIKGTIEEVAKFYDIETLRQYAEYLSGNYLSEELTAIKLTDKKDIVVENLIKLQQNIMKDRQTALLKLAAEIELSLAVELDNNKKLKPDWEEKLTKVFLKYPDYFKDTKNLHFRAENQRVRMPGSKSGIYDVWSLREVKDFHAKFFNDDTGHSKSDIYITDKDQIETIKKGIKTNLLNSGGSIKSMIEPIAGKNHYPAFSSAEKVMHVTEIASDRKNRFFKPQPQPIAFITEINRENNNIEHAFYYDKNFQDLSIEKKMVIAISRVETFKQYIEQNLKEKDFTILIKGDMDLGLAYCMESWCEKMNYDFETETTLKQKLEEGKSNNPKMYPEINDRFMNKINTKHPWIPKVESKTISPTQFVK